MLLALKFSTLRHYPISVSLPSSFYAQEVYGSFYFIEYVGDALISGYLRPLSISTHTVMALIKLIELFSYFRYADGI